MTKDNMDKETVDFVKTALGLPDDDPMKDVLSRMTDEAAVELKDLLGLDEDIPPFLRLVPGRTRHRVPPGIK